MTKFFVVSPIESFVPQSPVLVSLNPNLQTGDHIALKKNYSELRAHYWVWKNEPPCTDVVGFFQYRRYLDLRSGQKGRPYTIHRYPCAQSHIVPADVDFDIIAPLPEFTGEQVYKHYCRTHNKADLPIIKTIINKYYPEYLKAMDVYLNGKSEYYCNLYIMRRYIFDGYCKWLFHILGEYDTLVCGNVSPRAQGYLAERLFGIWFTKVKLDNLLCWNEVPRVHFWGFDDERHNLKLDKLVNFFLPPGSSLRARVRRSLKK